MAEHFAGNQVYQVPLTKSQKQNFGHGLLPWLKIANFLKQTSWFVLPQRTLLEYIGTNFNLPNVLEKMTTSYAWLLILPMR
jgi:hypothetical protein